MNLILEALILTSLTLARRIRVRNQILKEALALMKMILVQGPLILVKPPTPGLRQPNWKARQTLASMQALTMQALTM